MSDINEESRQLYSDDLWQSLLLAINSSRSTLINERHAETVMEAVPLDSKQYMLAKQIYEANDLDVQHRIVANELGMTARVIDLDAWIANKPKRRFS